jgi:hypothetical protein
MELEPNAWEDGGRETTEVGTRVGCGSSLRVDPSEGHDSISKQVHVNLTEVNMHGTRIARIVVRHVSEATHPMDHRAQE